MSNEPKNIWKRNFKGRLATVVWAGLAVFAIMLGSVLQAMVDFHYPYSDWLANLGVFAAMFFAAFLVCIYIVWPLLKFFFWKHWRRTVFWLACLATLVALFYAEEDWRSKRALDQFKRNWIAQGGNFDIAPPPVPDEQNFALTPIAFTSYGSMLTRDGKRIPWKERDTNFVERIKIPDALDYGASPANGGGAWEKAELADLKPWQDYYRGLAAKTNYFPVAAQPQTPAKDVLLALGRYDATVEELREASRLPYSRFPLEYDKDDPASILLPHLAALKSCTQTLRLRALAELQDGQPDKALADIRLMLYLAQSLRSEKVLISHLVRIAMVAIAMQPIYEGLATHAWSDAQLAGLETDLGKLDFIADYDYAMRGEMDFALAETEHLRRSRNLQGLGVDDNNNPLSHTLWFLRFAPASFFFWSELNMLQMHERWTLPMVDVADKIISPAIVRQKSAEADKHLKHGWPYNILAKMIFPAFSTYAHKCARIQSSVDLARTAIALERYRLAHGNYPGSLDALAPQFIAQVPHDLINGQPLKYRLEADGNFVLYSVGWNEKDDGGIVGYKKGGEGKVPDYESGDLVWRYPQK